MHYGQFGLVEDAECKVSDEEMSHDEFDIDNLDAFGDDDDDLLLLPPPALPLGRPLERNNAGIYMSMHTPCLYA
jgi:hypothetical protein